MIDEKAVVEIHPEGEPSPSGFEPSEVVTSADTFAGKIQMKRVPEAAVSSLGLMPLFIEFLKTSGRFDEWVEECPSQYSSPNAPRKRDVLGIFMRLAIPGKHTEAVTSRPLALYGIARRTRHSNQTTVEATSTHSNAGPMAQALNQ